MNESAFNITTNDYSEIHVIDDGQYPSCPRDKEKIFDKKSNMMKIWDGERWLSIRTRRMER